MKKENEKLRKEIEKLKSANSQLTDELKFFSDKINDCHENLETANMFSECEIPSELSIGEEDKEHISKGQLQSFYS